MGRYYSGDIEGKFWFSVQASDDALYFGGCEVVPSDEIAFRFTTDDLSDIEEGIERCREELAHYRTSLDLYFTGDAGYTDARLARYLGVAEPDVTGIVAWYARLLLGEKIHAKVKETGACNFTAEC